MSARRSATSTIAPRYEALLPKPLRAHPKCKQDRLSFVRPHGSYGGFSAWDPPQQSEEVLKRVFKNPDLDGFRSNDIAWLERAKYAIGDEVGNRAAREYARNIKATAAGETTGFLSDIALAMLGKPSEEMRCGEAIAFFCELEEILHQALHRAPAPKQKSKAKKKPPQR
jgi:hypothetical protein